MPVGYCALHGLVDDVTTMGGTLAEMAHHIQSGGGEVVGIVTLVNAGRSAIMTPSKLQITVIDRRYGDDIRQLFGIEPAALTRDEATYILGFRDADGLRNRAATAERQRSERLRARGIQEKVDPQYRGDGSGRSVSAGEIRTHLSRAIKAIVAPVTVYDTVAAARADGIGVPDDSRGFSAHGRIGLIAESLPDMLTAEETLWHEIQLA